MQTITATLSSTQSIILAADRKSSESIDQRIMSGMTSEEIRDLTEARQALWVAAREAEGDIRPRNWSAILTTLNLRGPARVLANALTIISSAGDPCIVCVLPARDKILFSDYAIRAIFVALAARLGDHVKCRVNLIDVSEGE